MLGTPDNKHFLSNGINLSWSTDFEMRVNFELGTGAAVPKQDSVGIVALY